jgi:hypothetical protein
MLFYFLPSYLLMPIRNALKKKLLFHSVKKKLNEGIVGQGADG